MKFSFKKLAAAVVLAAAATGASAAIDNGATGNGELFFNIWDANGSYSYDLGVSIDSFTSLLAAPGAINLSYNIGADNVFTSFLTSASLSDLVWNVVATDQNGDRRVLATSSEKPDGTQPNDSIRTLAGKIGMQADAINVASGGAVSVAVNSASEAYAGQEAWGPTYTESTNFITVGTLANNSYASGIDLLRIDGKRTGVAASIYTPYVDGSSVKVYFDASNTLHIAAVPEPESYAMLLAGLGMIGFMARRRLGNRA